MQPPEETTPRRRTMLKALGALSTAGVATMAGCADSGDDDEDDGANGTDGDDGADGGTGTPTEENGDGTPTEENGDGTPTEEDGDGTPTEEDGDGTPTEEDGGDGEDTPTDDGDGGDGGGESLSGQDYPAVDEWLTETEVGGADDTYDGSIMDLREEDSPTVDVGAPGNGDGFAFEPSAIAVSAGTEVQWVWTGEGDLHNVVAAPDAQTGESDFEFSSGDPVEEEGTEFTFTFEEAGVALYHCEPHISQGMKGAVVVE